MQKKGVVVTLIGIVFLSGCGGGISKERMENGKKVYQMYCQTCHMEDGGGVPNINASLKGSAYVAGDKEKLVRIVFHGSAEFTNEPERRYQNKMPALPNLTDKEIADLLTYIRNSFANKASAVVPKEVKLIREK